MTDTIQSPADAATEAAIEAHISNAPPEKTEAAFNRSTIEHHRSAGTPAGDTWRDGSEAEPLAPMPEAPAIATTEVESAIAKLNGYGADHAALVQEWSGDFGANLQYAREAFKALAASDPDLIAKVDASGLGDHPSVLRFLAKQGRLSAGLTGDYTIAREQRNAPTMPTPTKPAPKGNAHGSEEIRSELSRLMRDNPPGSARYAQPEIQSRIQQLHRTIAGSDSIVGRGGRVA